MYIVKPQGRGGERTAIEDIELPQIVDFSKDIKGDFLGILRRAFPEIIINYGHTTEGIPFYPLNYDLSGTDMSGFYLPYLAGSLTTRLAEELVTKCMVKALANTWIAEANKVRAGYRESPYWGLGGKLTATVAPADTVSYANTVALPIYGWLVTGKLPRIEMETSVRFDISPV